MPRRYRGPTIIGTRIPLLQPRLFLRGLRTSSQRVADQSRERHSAEIYSAFVNPLAVLHGMRRDHGTKRHSLKALSWLSCVFQFHDLLSLTGPQQRRYTGLKNDRQSSFYLLLEMAHEADAAQRQ